MANKIIAINTKMAMMYEEVDQWKNMLRQYNDKNIIMFPSSLFISYFKDLNISIGIQNISCYENRARTGQISVEQCQSLGLDYVLIGHWEVLEFIGETDDSIIDKIELALKNNMKVIFFVGEYEQSIDKAKTELTLEAQLNQILYLVSLHVPKESLNNIVIAYEPRWAIGTGNAIKIDDISYFSKYIKKVVKENYQVIPKVIYGGGVNTNNIEEIISLDDLDGVIISSVSNNILEVNKIIEVVENQ